MLHRSTSAPAWSPVRWVTNRLGALNGPSSALLRFVLIAAILCAIACIYLWQLNELSNVHDATIRLQWKARTLEEKNVGLAEQLAQWNSPAYVDKLSIEQGYIAAPQHIIRSPAVGIPSADAPGVAAAPAASGSTR